MSVSSAVGRDRPISIQPILSVNFVSTLGFSIVLPFLIFLVTRWGGNALVYGVVGATYSFFQLIGAPILGRWSDVYGRRRILLLSQIGTLLSWCILLAAFLLPDRALATVQSQVLGTFTLTLPLMVLFVARAADGITGGNVSVANAYLADVTPESERSTNFGKMAIAANLGFILGPALAGLLGATAWGEVLPVMAALLISLVATLIIAFRLPESRPCSLCEDPEQVNVRRVFGQEHKDCFQMSGAEPVSTREMLRLARVPRLLTMYFLVMLGFNFFYIAFPVYAVRGLGWTVVDTGIFFAVLGLLMVVVQGPVLRWASSRWSDGTLVTAGSLLLAMSFLLFNSDAVWRLYTGAGLLALGNGIMWPSVLSLLSKAAGTRYQGAVQGFAGSAGAVASIAGLVIGGALYGLLESRIFLLSAVVILAVCVTSFGLRISTRSSASPER